MKTASKINEENNDALILFENFDDSYSAKEFYRSLRNTPRAELTWYEKGYEDALTKIYKEEREKEEKEKKAKEELIKKQKEIEKKERLGGILGRIPLRKGDFEFLMELLLNNKEE